MAYMGLSNIKQNRYTVCLENPYNTRTPCRCTIKSKDDMKQAINFFLHKTRISSESNDSPLRNNKITFMNNEKKENKQQSL